MGPAHAADPTLVPGKSSRDATGRTTRDRTKHPDDFPEAVTVEDLESILNEVFDNPTEWKSLKRGRTAYYDAETGIVLIVDPNNPIDGGTAVRPNDPKKYYDGLE